MHCFAMNNDWLFLQRLITSNFSIYTRHENTFMLAKQKKCIQSNRGQHWLFLGQSGVYNYNSIITTGWEEFLGRQHIGANCSKKKKGLFYWSLWRTVKHAARVIWSWSWFDTDLKHSWKVMKKVNLKIKLEKSGKLPTLS